MDRNAALSTYVLRLADNSLILAQRLGEWVGHAPALEEEMALANFALDHMGQARMLFSLAADIEDKGRTEDDLAFLRDSIDFHNVLLVEQPNGHFGQTIARQFLFDSFYQYQLEALSASEEPRLAEIAAKARKENHYHLRHTKQWLVRLGDGTSESHRRMQTAVDDLWRFTGELFSRDAIDEWVAAAGVGPDPATLVSQWDAYVNDAFAEATLTRPDSGWMASGGKEGRHTEHHGFMLADMQFLQRAYPGTQW